MIKIGLIFAVVMAIFSGCAKIEFEDAAGNKASYYRLGRTALNDVEYENSGVKLKVGSAKGDSGKLGEAMANTSEALLNVSKVVTTVP